MSILLIEVDCSATDQAIELRCIKLKHILLHCTVSHRAVLGWACNAVNGPLP